MLKAISKILLILIVIQTSSAHVIINSLRKPTPRETESGRSSLPPRVLSRNNAGCDMFIASCGPNGGCCDDHDNCYEINKCTALSWIPGTESSNCWNCNWNVMKCVVTKNPGMSSCCSDGTCGMDEEYLEGQAQGR